MGDRMGACCGCGKTGPYARIVDHVTGCEQYAQRCQDEPAGYEGFDPAKEWARLQREQDDGADLDPGPGATVQEPPAEVAEDIPDDRVVVLDKRGEAQRESDEIRSGFGLYGRIAVFVRKERFRELGYPTAAAWWAGERIAACSETAEADRKSLVRALTGAGLSVRATGAMLAISPAQAQRDKTGKSSNTATTREGRKTAKVSPHTSKTAGQAANGGETAGAVAVTEDPFAFMVDGDGSAGQEGGSAPGPVTCPGCRSKDELVSDLQAQLEAAHRRIRMLDGSTDEAELDELFKTGR